MIILPNIVLPEIPLAAIEITKAVLCEFLAVETSDNLNISDLETWKSLRHVCSCLAAVMEVGNTLQT
jgi:hypothetical protein